MGKGLLIIILGTVMTPAIVSMNLLKTANSGTDNTLDYRVVDTALVDTLTLSYTA